MAKVVYTKHSEFKLFGFKIVELNTKYSEHSNDDETDEDKFYIDLIEMENRNLR